MILRGKNLNNLKSFKCIFLRSRTFFFSFKKKHLFSCGEWVDPSPPLRTCPQLLGVFYPFTQQQPIQDFVDFDPQALIYKLLHGRDKLTEGITKLYQPFCFNSPQQNTRGTICKFSSYVCLSVCEMVFLSPSNLNLSCNVKFYFQNK